MGRGDVMYLCDQLIKRYRQMPIPVRAAGWFFVCSFLQKAISSITTPIFTRLMSPAEYGQYNVFHSWMGIITIVVSLYLCGGVYVQGLVKYEDVREEYSSALQGLSFLLVLAWTGIYLLFRDFWNALFSLNTVQMLTMLSMIWTSTVFGFWSANERVDLKYRRLVAITVFVLLAKPLIGIYFVLHAQDKVTARIIGTAMVQLFAYSWMFFAQVRRGRKIFVWKYWKHALMFSLPLIPHNFSMIVLNSSDRIMISQMIGDDVAGIYSLAYSISLIMTMFNTALQQTLEPWRYRKQKENRQEDMANMTYSTMILIAVLNLLLIAFAPEIVRIYAPNDYYDAIWVIPPISMSVFFAFMYDFFASFEFYFEKTKYIMVATSVGALLNIVLNYVFIPIYGYYAAGYTTLVCYIVYAVAHYLFMKNICKEYLDNKKVYSVRILCFISMVFMGAGFALLFLYQHFVIRYSLILFFVGVLALRRKKALAYLKKLMRFRTESNC